MGYLCLWNWSLGPWILRVIFSLSICVYLSNLGTLVENVGRCKGGLLTAVIGTHLVEVKLYAFTLASRKSNRSRMAATGGMEPCHSLPLRSLTGGWGPESVHGTALLPLILQCHPPATSHVSFHHCLVPGTVGGSGDTAGSTTDHSPALLGFIFY